MPTPPVPAWPDITERDRWTAALSDAARRVQQDRGVADDWWLEVAYGNLWARYGQNRVAVAGPGPDISGPEELFEDIDTWVAFERPAGPGVVLERDRQADLETRSSSGSGSDDVLSGADPIGRLVDLMVPDDGAQR